MQWCSQAACCSHACRPRIGGRVNEHLSQHDGHQMASCRVSQRVPRPTCRLPLYLSRPVPHIHATHSTIATTPQRTRTDYADVPRYPPLVTCTCSPCRVRAACRARSVAGVAMVPRSTLVPTLSPHADRLRATIHQLIVLADAMPASIHRGPTSGTACRLYL